MGSAMADQYQVMGSDEMKQAKGHELQQQNEQVAVPYGYPPSQTPAVGYPAYGHAMTVPPLQQAPPQYHSQPNPYTAGMVPPNAIYGPPAQGVGLQETFFGDTPAPFECPHCGKPGLTNVKSTPSLASCVACMMTIVGVCFLSRSCDCLWHKQHFCENCGEKVAEVKKSDPCIIVDPLHWTELSYAIPA